MHMLRRCLGLVFALPITIYSTQLQAQTPLVDEPGYTATLTFDIVTIRQSPPAGADFHVSVSSPPHSSRFEVTNLPARALLQIAYGFDAPIIGMPDWTTNTFYNIQARSDDETDAKLAKLSSNEVGLEKRHAIRLLLAQRFDLKTHEETRNSAIYYLVVAKGGIRMKSSPAPPPPADGAPPPPQPPADVQTHGSQHGLEFVGTNSPMRAISGALSSMVEAPVVDKTVLTGAYNYTLQFGRPWSEHDPDSWPVIFTAVQDQLGLKLEAVRESVPNLIVDRITRPTDN